MKKGTQPIALVGVGMFISTFVLMTGTVSWFNWWSLEGGVRYAIMTIQITAVVLILMGVVFRTRTDVDAKEPATSRCTRIWQTRKCVLPHRVTSDVMRLSQGATQYGSMGPQQL